MIDSINASGLAGVRRGLESAESNAAKVSSAFTDGGDGDILTPSIGLKLDGFQVAASSKVIKVGEDLQATILDILA